MGCRLPSDSIIAMCPCSSVYFHAGSCTSMYHRIGLAKGINFVVGESYAHPFGMVKGLTRIRILNAYFIVSRDHTSAT